MLQSIVCARRRVRRSLCHFCLVSTCAWLALVAVVQAQEANTAGEVAAPDSDQKEPPEKELREKKVQLAKYTGQLLERKDQIRRARETALKARKAQIRRINELTTDKRSVERRLAALRELVEKKEQVVSKKEDELSAKKEKKAELESQSREILHLLGNYLDRVEKHIADGIAWQLSLRASSVKRSRTAVTGKNARASAGLATIGRIQQEEESLGRLVETGTLEIEIDGERKAVQAFHLGMLAVVFANEDGSIVGFTRRGEKPEDALGREALNADATRGYLVAVDILRRRRTPSIVDLFLPSLPVAEDAARSEEAEEEPEDEE